MRTTIIFTIFFALISCRSSYTSMEDKPKGSNIVESKNGEEYELIIIDPGFDQWFATNKRPVSFHELSYYENQNQRYAQAWNQKVSQQGLYGPNYPFENRIDYDPTKSYGLELNYKLYYYFKYIEEVYGNRYNFPM